MRAPMTAGNLSHWIWQLPSYFGISQVQVVSSWEPVCLGGPKASGSQHRPRKFCRFHSRVWRRPLGDHRACLPSHLRDFQVQICQSELCLACSGGKKKIYQVLADGCNSEHHGGSLQLRPSARSTGVHTGWEES